MRMNRRIIVRIFLGILFATLLLLSFTACASTPEEKYYVQVILPVCDAEIPANGPGPTFMWYLSEGYASEFVIEIDCSNGDSERQYTELRVNGITSYRMTKEEWVQLKELLPAINGVLNVKWRIRIDYQTKEGSYFTEWNSFTIVD